MSLLVGPCTHIRTHGCRCHPLFYDSHNSIQAPLTCRLGLCVVAIIFVLRILVLTSLPVALRLLLLVAIIVLRLLVLGSLLRIHVLASLLVALRRLLFVAIILVHRLLSWGVSLGSLSFAAP